MDLPWEQIANLGAGGMFAVIIVWLVLKFLDNRKTDTDRIILILENQTKILERSTDRLDDVHEKVTVLHDRRSVQH